jgi:aromatic ring-opening dioxygenase catalytic subunit (LigB family)
MQALMAGMSGRVQGVTGLDFDAWLSEAATHPDSRERNRRLIACAGAPGARHAHPREEHLLPLHVVAGAAGADRGRKTLEDHVMGAVESAFQFGWSKININQGEEKHES